MGEIIINKYTKKVVSEIDTSMEDYLTNSDLHYSIRADGFIIIHDDKDKAKIMLDLGLTED